MNRSIVKLAGAAGLVVALLAVTVGSVSADSLLGGKVRTGDVVTVGPNETVSTDLYAFAREVTINGTVHGDVVAFGATVSVNGKVDGDVIVGAGTVNVAGAVGGSVIGGGGTVDVDGSVGGAVRVGGGQVSVGGTIAHDVLAAGGRLTVGGTVSGDLVFGGGDTTVTGTVTGSIEGSASTYSRTGTVGGSENVKLEPQSAYQSPFPTITVTRDPVLDAVRQFVAVVLLAALALWLVPAGMRASEEVVRRRPIPAFGGGILVLVAAVVGLLAIIVLMIVLAIIFGAATLGVLVLVDVFAALLAFFVLLMGLIVAAAFYTDAVVGLALARYLAPRLMPARAGVAAGAASDASGAGLAGARPMSRLEELGWLAVGAAVVVIFTSLPIVGPFIELVVVLVGLGAMGIVGWGAWQRRRHGSVGPDGGSVGATLSWGKPAGS
jgi:hypothetical protein